MGSLNSRNEVAIDNGIAYRQATKKLWRLYEINKPYIVTNKSARIANDLLLAKIAYHEAVLLCSVGSFTMMANSNPIAKDYKKLALNKNRFDRFFNLEVMR